VGLLLYILEIDKHKIGPLKFQFKGDNSTYMDANLPVEGSVFSDRNTRSTALIDLMKAISDWI
jgi:hypothetical protein